MHRRTVVEADLTMDNDLKAMELTYHDKIIEHLQEQVTSLERQLRRARQVRPRQPGPDSRWTSKRMATHSFAIDKNQQTPGRSVELLLSIPRLPTRTLGERIKCLRHKRGLHQEQLARLAGVDEMTIVRWEKDRSAPKGPRLTRLLRALDAQADELRADTGQDHDVSQRPPLVRSANVRVLPPSR